ncbi:PRC-barrel domain-containing protein [Syntrophaceticus schinkii]|uniref:Putative PRC-barrel domain protein n=1 Tax=Syntrophaceticus schinkii TaxID=499207 RepID=A0A0B7MPP9_9FIRM|nr:PRC-barrel domain-containing protein [Syntrophaceticus schinkii]CEO90006.1 putative PRC-barrel domain protein [Syntrophaceticus schinkii]
MQKGREIIGLPVVSLDTGDEIGVVDDILWSHRDMRICCLVVGDHCLPFAEISSIGTDAITVSGREVLQEDDVSLCEMREAFPLPKEDSGIPSETREPSPCLRSVNQTGGELVLSQDGNNLGTLKDVIFDADEGKLLGYELSTGVVGGSSLRQNDYFAGNGFILGKGSYYHRIYRYRQRWSECSVRYAVVDRRGK